MSDALEVARGTIASFRSQPRTRNRMLRFIDAHPEALWRSCANGHVTTSALVVDAGGERTLLLLHRKIGRWLQPGGHCDGDGDLRRSALREAVEETGISGLHVLPEPIDLDVHAFRAPAEPEHLHLDVRYLVTSPADAVPAGNDELDDLAWFTWTQAARLDLDAGLRRLMRCARRVLRTA